MSPPSPGHRAGPVDPLPLVAASVLLTAIVLVGVFPRLWYGLHDVSDIPLYHHYATLMEQGAEPFSPDLRIEYPPLALPLLRLPGAADLADYTAGFGMWMGLIALATAAVTALAAQALWPGRRAAWLAALLFPVGVALTGAIIVNRYDVAVALVLAAILLCVIRRWYVAAAFAVGLGFALKFTPAALLPLVLVLAGPPNRWLGPMAAFSIAAFVPFLPHLLAHPEGVVHVFRYHLERPLQIESVLGTPLLLGQLLGAGWARHGDSHGSQSLEAPGAEFAAALSGPLTILAVAAVCGLAWRRRARLADVPEDRVLAALTLLLALVTASKVLSPQFLVWLLPAWALFAARDRALGLLVALALLLTQVEFPALYWRFVELEPMPVAVVVARNLVLVAAFGYAAWRLWRLPEREDTASAAAMAASSSSPAMSEARVHAGGR
jgi:hypothetical protein